MIIENMGAYGGGPNELISAVGYFVEQVQGVMEVVVTREL